MKVSARITAGALVGVGTVSAVVALFVHRARVNEIEGMRRVNGDVVVVAYTVPFPDLDRVIRLAQETAHATRAAAFTIWMVDLVSAVSSSSGLLKLGTTDTSLAGQLRLTGSDPRPLAPGQPVEVAIGTLLANELHVKVGDGLTVRVQPGAGAIGGATLNVTVRSVVDWGLPYHNRHLLYADLSHLAAFGLHVTGVELAVDSADSRKPVAKTLERLLGEPFRALTIEELVARPSTSD
jgi:ABC-type lipoprotein release transport system permease subunit